MLWNSPKKTQSYFDTIIRTLNDVLGDPNREWLLWGLYLVGLGYHFASKKIKQISEKNSHFLSFFPLRNYPTIELSDPEVTGHRYQEEENITAKD